MNEAVNIPAWVTKTENRWLGSIFSVRTPSSLARNLIKLYAVPAETEKFSPYSLLPPSGSPNENQKMLKIMQTLEILGSMLLTPPPGWSEYKYVSFYTDMLPLYLAVRNYAENTGYYSGSLFLKYDIKNFNYAVGRLTSEQLESLSERLNYYFYSRESSEVLDASPKGCKCSSGDSKLSNNTECRYAICFIHLKNRSNLFNSLMLTDYFGKVFITSSFKSVDLPGQFYHIVSEIYSGTFSASYEQRDQLLTQLMSLRPEEGPSVMSALISKGTVRVHVLAEMLLPHMENDETIAEAVISNSDRKISDFNQAVHKRYLIEECGWAEDIPEEWFKRALSTETIVEAYRKSVSERRESVGRIL